MSEEPFVKEELFSAGRAIRWVVGHDPDELWWSADFDTSYVGTGNNGFSLSIMDFTRRSGTHNNPHPQVKMGEGDMLYLTTLIQNLIAFQSEILRQTGQTNLIEGESV